MGEVFTKYTSDKGLIFKMYKKLTKLNMEKGNIKKQITQLKNDQRSLIDTSPNSTHRWPIDI